MAKLQNYQIKNEQIRSAFETLKRDKGRIDTRLNLSWSNWGFGRESLAASAHRLAQAQIKFIELHGNHYGPDLGYKPAETLSIMKDFDLKVSGICGMFSAENDLSSNSGAARQRAIDYIEREIDFAVAVEAQYILIVPGAVGRPQAYDDSEFDRSVASLQLVADRFAQANIKAAIEPIRSAEVSFCHTIADAKRYIKAIDHPGVQHINGDIYHMQNEESHISTAILDAGQQLTNLHLADSNRCALGDGSLDVDTMIMALYAIGYNRPGCFISPEPLGPGGDPYPAMHGKTDPKILDDMVRKTADYLRQRETYLLES